MENASTTIAKVRSECQEATIVTGKEPFHYQPTEKQIFFFLLIRLHKQKFVFYSYEDALPNLSEEDLVYWKQMIAKHLGESGAMVADLKRRDEMEWERLRVQIERSVHRKAGGYGCADRDDLIGEAYRNTLFKIFNVLSPLLTPQQIEESNDTLARFCALQEGNRKVYDFTSPFLAYANRIAKNELLTQLRIENGRPKPYVSLDNNENSTEDLLTSMENKDSYAEARLKYREQITKLLEIIQNDLSPKPRQVIMYTLAARRQFRDVLEGVDLDFDLYKHFTGCSNDTDIAHVLGISENGVRVHRNNGKKRVTEFDPALGFLLENLMARRGSDDDEK